MSPNQRDNVRQPIGYRTRSAANNLLYRFQNAPQEAATSARTSMGQTQQSPPARPSRHKNNTGNTNTNGHQSTKPDSSDTTAPHPDQLTWSIHNLPLILYILRPGYQHTRSRARIKQTTSPFNPLQKIRDFSSVLPQQISSQVEGWRLEAWSRLDRRIENQDILDRVNPVYRVTAQDLERRRDEFRRTFRVADWRSQRSVNEIVRVVRAAGVDVKLNTTRGITPGLVDPAKGEGGGRIPVPVTRERVVGLSPASPFFVMGLNRALGGSSAPNWGKLSERQGGKSVSDLGQDSSRRLVMGMPLISPVQKRGEDRKSSIAVPHKKRKTSARRALTDPSPYRENSHRSTPTREPESSERTMTLEEYLTRNKMSFEEYLCRSEDDAPDDEKGTDKRGKEKRAAAGVATEDAIDPWLSAL